MEVSAMASIMALPRKCCLNVMFQMFSFLKIKHTGVTMFHPTEPTLIKLIFQLSVGLQQLVVFARRIFLLILLSLEAQASLSELLLIIIILETLLLVAQELSLSCSLTMLLPFLVQRNRGVARHQVSVQSLLQ